MMGGTLVDELRNRFIVYSRINVPVMIFSAGHFNVSSVLTMGRVFMAIQAYDIEIQEIVMLKFLVKFRHVETANDFHKYVTKESPCTNSIIPINIPEYITL